MLYLLNLILISYVRYPITTKENNGVIYYSYNCKNYQTRLQDIRYEAPFLSYENDIKMILDCLSFYPDSYYLSQVNNLIIKYNEIVLLTIVLNKDVSNRDMVFDIQDMKRSILYNMISKINISRT